MTERTRRIDRPRFGMVVTDGAAGRVWMLVSQTRYLPHSSDSDLIWDAVQINTPEAARRGAMRQIVRARVFLAPGEFAEVVADAAEPEDCLFVGGPMDGRRMSTGGIHYWRAAVPPDLSTLFSAYEDPLTADLGIKAVDYELCRDGRYHLTGA